MYNLIVRPLLFLIDPEKVHRMLLNWLRIYRYLLPVRACVRGHYQVDEPFSYGSLRFKNRIGLSAGFDKNAETFDELADFGFGFLEVGTVTRLSTGKSFFPYLQAGRRRITDLTYRVQ